MTTTLPPPHARLTVSADGRSWPSRVEAVGPGTLTVARPFDVPLEGGPAPGAALELRWAEEAAAFRLPVRLVESVRDGIVALWVVAPDGAATRVQRRAHFRVGLDSEARVTVGEETRTAHLVDASEAAVRLRVDPAARPPDDTEVVVAFDVRGEPFEAAGTVLRAWPSRRADGAPASDVVVILRVDERQARDLRRALLAEQARLRRLARG